MKVFSVFLVVILMATIMSCAQVRGTNRYSSDLGASSAVTVSDPNFKPASNEPLSWYKDVIWIGEFAESKDGLDKAFIQLSISKNLRAKGYQLEDTSSDYMVAALVLLGAVKDHPEVQSLVKLYPDLSASVRGRDKGTLIVAILPRAESPQEGGKSVWRGAMQILLAKEGELPIEARKQRVESAVARLMASIPKAI